MAEQPQAEPEQSAAPAPPGDFDQAYEAAFAAARAEAEAPPGGAQDPTPGEAAPPGREPASPEGAQDSSEDESLEPSPVEGVSRRQWAEIRRKADERAKAQQQEIERLKAEQERRTAEDAEIERAFGQFFGTEDELADLQERLRDRDPDAALRYADLMERNRFFGRVVQRAQDRVNANLYAGYQAAGTREGVDGERLAKASDFKEFLDAFAEGVEKHATEPLKAAIEEQKAEIAGLKTRLAGAGAAPERGGRSALPRSLIAVGSDGLVTDEWIERATRGEFSTLDLGEGA